MKKRINLRNKSLTSAKETWMIKIYAKSKKTNRSPMKTTKSPMPLKRSRKKSKKRKRVKSLKRAKAKRTRRKKKKKAKTLMKFPLINLSPSKAIKMTKIWNLLETLRVLAMMIMLLNLKSTMFQMKILTKERIKVKMRASLNRVIPNLMAMNNLTLNRKLILTRKTLSKIKKTRVKMLTSKLKTKEKLILMISKTTMNRKRSKNNLNLKLKMPNKTSMKLTPVALSIFYST